MRFVYGGLSVIMMVCAIIFFFICVLAYKIFLTELIVSTATFVLLSFPTLIVVATAGLTYYFYNSYMNYAD